MPSINERAGLSTDLLNLPAYYALFIEQIRREHALLGGLRFCRQETFRDGMRVIVSWSDFHKSMFWLAGLEDCRPVPQEQDLS